MEIKAKRGTSIDWAIKMRRYIYAHGLQPQTTFFLLALPDCFYLWKNHHQTPDDLLQPTRIINPDAFLRTYFESVHIAPATIGGKSFKLIITTWLNQVLMANTAQDLIDTQQTWIVECGLFEHLAGGHLELAMAA